MNRGKLAAIALGLTLLCAAGANAADKIVVGYTATSVNSLTFVAKEKGLFDRRGVSVELLAMTSANVIVPSIIANSVQVGTITVPSLIQADDGGLDLVAVGGLNGLNAHVRDTGLLARTGVDIRTAQDLKGRKVAVGTIGAISYVMMVKWLMQHGVDPASVTFVEAGFGQMPDLIRSGSLDAVFLPDPLMSAIVKAGTGHFVAQISDEFPDGLVSTVSAFARSWVDQHTQETRAYQAAIRDAAALANAPANEAEVRGIIIKYLNLKPGTLDGVPMPRLVSEVSPADLKWWIDAMNEQKLLRTTLDPAKLIDTP